jgi:hypothetical protein
MKTKCVIFTAALLAQHAPSLRAGDFRVPDGKNPVLSPSVFAPPRENQWRVSAGYLYRDLGNVDFHRGSRSPGFVLPRYFGGNRHSVPPIGGIDGVANRSYADGFVNIDVSGSTDGQTWFWGYDSNAQVSGETIQFYHPGGRAREVSSYRQVEAPGSFGDSIEEGGPYVQLEYMMGTNAVLSWGPQVGFSFIGFDNSSTRSDFAAGQSFVDFDVTTRDRFDLGGVIAPQAPYRGTFDGPGALIPNVPSERTSSRSVADSGRIDFFNRVQESLDVDLYTFSPGLSVELRHDALYLNVAAGLAVNVVNWEAENKEILSVSRDQGKARVAREWRDRETGTDVLFGAYVQGTVGAQLTESVAVSAFARYDWNEKLEGSVGPSSFDVDLSGVSAGAMVTLRW